MTSDDATGPFEPRWLLWAREMQALAQTGLAFTRDKYDRERYQQLRGLAARIMARHAGLDARHFDVLFAQQTGYATPKIGVRGAVFRDDRILLVREIADEHRWTLPGGWADVNETPARPLPGRCARRPGSKCAPTSSPPCGIALGIPMASCSLSTFGGCFFCARSLAARCRPDRRRARPRSLRSTNCRPSYPLAGSCCRN